MEVIEKLNEAKKILEEVEETLLEKKGFCPYEIGFTLRHLEDAIKFFDENET